MSANLLLAWRNLWRSRRRTWLTVGAMIVCNTLMVFMLSLQFGTYDMMIESTLKTFIGHLQVQKEGYLDEPRMRGSFTGVAELTTDLRQQLGLEAVAARAEGFGLASSEARSLGIQITGVEPDYEPLVSTLPGLLTEGRWLSDNGAEEIVIGAVLARNLKIGVGDELTFLGTGQDGSMAAAIVTVVGIIDSGIPMLDRMLAQIPLGYFQSVFSMEDQAHRIVFDVARLDAVDRTLARVKTLIGDRPELVALDWDQIQPGIMQGIQADMASAWFMYGVLILLVSFSVLNTQLMSVLERTRELGVMLALGIKPARLARLVMLETSVMAVMGLVIGVACGGAIALYLSYTGFWMPGLEEAMARYNLPGSIYPKITALGFLLGPSIVCLGALVASIYPALRLLWLQPVQAMRAV